MDPENNLQDILRCTVCETLEASIYCWMCEVNLCKDCIEEHLSDTLKCHKMMLIKHKRFTPTYRRCEKHPQEHYELVCQKCHTLLCKQCIASHKKEGHPIVHILKELNTKREILKEDLAELKNIYQEYKNIAFKVTHQRLDVEENSQNLKTALDKHGDYLRRKIDRFIDQLKSDLENTTSDHTVILKKEEEKITQSIFEIKETIEFIQNTLEANDFLNILVFKSRNAEFRKLPHSLKVSLPVFTPKEISNEQMLQQFGSLSKLFLKKELLDESIHIKTMKTDHGSLFNVTCLRDEAIWTSGRDKFIKQYDLSGELVKTIETKSAPYDIEVTKSGDLVYTDNDAGIVNLVKDTQVQAVIKGGLIRPWKPLGVCNTSVDELLVVMVHDNYTQTKVVRYSGSTEKQSIQYNENGEPMYTSDHGRKYISENRNLDICVSDIGARAVVVVDQSGKLRFTYTGTPNTNMREFHPRGITTDSQGQILTADYNNDCIHIVDQDGQFLRYIDVCVLREPFGLCVDTSDNLFVAKNTGEVEKIQYYR